jgi:hypothetical protein
LHLKRVLAGASIVGAVGLPLSWLAAGVAAAEPNPAPAVNAPGEPLPPIENRQHQEERKANTTASDTEAPASSNIADEIARGLSQLPPPDLSSLPAPQVNVPVSIGLPGIGLGLVPDLSVPIVLGGIGPPTLPNLGGLPPPPDLSKLPPPPQLPGIGLPQLPSF